MISPFLCENCQPFDDAPVSSYDTSTSDVIRRTGWRDRLRNGYKPAPDDMRRLWGLTTRIEALSGEHFHPIRIHYYKD